MNRKLIVSICLAGFMAGCSFFNVNSEETSLTWYPPKASSADVVYLENPSQPYEEIGTVTVGTERRQSLDEVIERMRAEAARMGGDAITDVKTDATGTWQGLSERHLLRNAYLRSQFTAKVIVFKGAVPPGDPIPQPLAPTDEEIYDENLLK